MRIFPLLIIISLISCNGKSQENNKATQNVCFEYKDNFYSRVSKENIDEIISEYTKVNFKNILSYSIIKKQGKKPAIFVVYEKDNKLNFVSLHNSENKWCPIWSNELSENLSSYFKISDYKFEFNDSGEENDSSDIKTIIYKGCRPNSFCSEKGWFYFDNEENLGYTVIFSSEIEKFPFGLPQNYSTLKNLEVDLMSHIKSADDFKILMEFPKDRKIPSLNSEFIPKDIIQLLSKYDENTYDVRSVFTFDYNSDKKNDYIFRLTQKDYPYNRNKSKNGFYLFSNGTLSYLSSGLSETDIENLGDYDFPSDELIYFTNNDDEYLVITAVPKGSFNVDSSKSLDIYKRVGNTFTYQKNNEEIIKLITKKFNLNSTEYFIE